MVSVDSYWAVEGRALVDCAMGRLPADLEIRGGRWDCVQTGEIIADTDTAFLNHWNPYVGEDAGHANGVTTQVIDAKLDGFRFAEVS